MHGQVAATIYPAIRPSDPLFLFKKDLTDEEFWEQLRKIPKNDAVGYEPPKVPSIVHSLTAEKNHDTQTVAGHLHKSPASAENKHNSLSP
ncbi:hypothetical protein BGZ75_007113 [Mortierella antarctica]|nr:hypothetical protein BGZ75_007113 [Mortierella antarctica]